MPTLICANARLTGEEPRKRILRDSVTDLLTDWLQGQRGYREEVKARTAASEAVAEYPVLMTVSQVANVLGISRASVYRLIQEPAVNVGADGDGE